MLDFGRDICGDLEAAERREWLVTNGIGGYAMGTVACVATRRYHGLLIAAVSPPVERVLLLADLEETVTYHNNIYRLFTNHREDGLVDPTGFEFIERFRLEGTTPVWTYACADALLEKRIWMRPGENTTYVRYDLQRASGPLAISIRAMANYRDHHSGTLETWRMRVEPIQHGLQITPFPDGEREDIPPFYVFSDRAELQYRHDWYPEKFLLREAERGYVPHDTCLSVGLFQATLLPGESLTMVASTESMPVLESTATYIKRRMHERELLAAAQIDRGTDARSTAAIEQLILAADQFIVQRALPEDPDGATVIAGYPWFSDWGRDAMIALPGLTLATGRPEMAARILRTFAPHVSEGLLPNRFPDDDAEPEYNTADATLWYFEALRACYAATGDRELLAELFPMLGRIIEAHQRGTLYNIHVDAEDGLLYAGEEGVQLTWMDAKVEGRVITPRIGKAVEINALWYNALCCMAHFATELGKNADRYEKAARQTREGFARFWNGERGFCYDVLDGPDGHEAALRPNQLLAVALHYSPLEAEQQQAVVEVCAQQLLTSHGLRSLGPEEPGYIGQYVGALEARDEAYHQGTVWAWLIGPFAAAHLRVHGDRDQARLFLLPLLHHLGDAGLGSISEIFDGDPPFIPRGCPAQAWSVAEVLRLWQMTAQE